LRFGYEQGQVATGIAARHEGVELLAIGSQDLDLGRRRCAEKTPEEGAHQFAVRSSSVHRIVDKRRQSK
jgi:hypothetical protein